ncbi:hypothetical protein [Amycolatopsis lexingtonensis]|uniref:hypothetical protein n=1 Tax=Amycolatopsis lexingtonensis TaxID=218822 RepID=UPI003F71C813
MLDILREFPSAVVTDEIGALSRWRLSGRGWQATVLVEPGRWLGLEFEARDPATGRRATYDIDTDGQLGYAAEVERDIVEFLGHLRQGRVLCGQEGRKFVLVFPLDGAYVRVVRGRFLTRASTLAAARVGTDFVPLD